MKIKRKSLLIIGFLLFFFSVYGCSSIKFIIKNNNGKIYPVEKLLFLGQEAYSKGNYKIAIQYYEAVIKYYPDRKEFVTWAYYEIGFIYYVKKEYKKAKEYFNIVITKFKDQKSAYILARFMISKIKEISSNSEKK